MRTDEPEKIVIYHTDALNVVGDIVIPTDFAITLLTDRVEVLWGVAWCRGGAGNTEILDADYFQTHTIDEFESFLRQKASNEFVNWFNIKNNQKIRKLFDSGMAGT